MRAWLKCRWTREGRGFLQYLKALSADHEKLHLLTTDRLWRRGTCVIGSFFYHIETIIGPRVSWHPSSHFLATLRKVAVKTTKVVWTLSLVSSRSTSQKMLYAPLASVKHDTTAIIKVIPINFNGHINQWFLFCSGGATWTGTNWIPQSLRVVQYTNEVPQGQKQTPSKQASKRSTTVSWMAKKHQRSLDVVGIWWQKMPGLTKPM